jgi:predicted house-cleaning noncanonical NTP pyrophosphatase (MazG superfamily)
MSSVKGWPKLVRDRMPDMVVQNGNVPIYHVISDPGDIWKSLSEKLEEEIHGFATEEVVSVDKLVDVLEVAYAMARIKTIPVEPYHRIDLEQPRELDPIHLMAQSAAQFAQDPSVFALRDLRSRVYCVSLYLRGVFPSDLEYKREEKYKERGGFERMIVIEAVK